jgi:hypothetical protein
MCLGSDSGVHDGAGENCARRRLQPAIENAHVRSQAMGSGYSHVCGHSRKPIPIEFLAIGRHRQPLRFGLGNCVQRKPGQRQRFQDHSAPGKRSRGSLSTAISSGLMPLLTAMRSYSVLPIRISRPWRKSAGFWLNRLAIDPCRHA